MFASNNKFSLGWVKLDTTTCCKIQILFSHGIGPFVDSCHMIKREEKEQSLYQNSNQLRPVGNSLQYYLYPNLNCQVLSSLVTVWGHSLDLSDQSNRIHPYIHDIYGDSTRTLWLDTQLNRILWRRFSVLSIISTPVHREFIILHTRIASMGILYVKKSLPISWNSKQSLHPLCFSTGSTEALESKVWLCLDSYPC